MGTVQLLESIGSSCMFHTQKSTAHRLMNITHSQETCQSLPTTPSFDTQTIRAEQYGSPLPSSRLLWQQRQLTGPLPAGRPLKSDMADPVILTTSDFTQLVPVLGYVHKESLCCAPT